MDQFPGSGSTHFSSGIGSSSYTLFGMNESVLSSKTQNSKLQASRKQDSRMQDKEYKFSKPEAHPAPGKHFSLIIHVRIIISLLVYNLSFLFIKYNYIINKIV